MAIVLQPLGTVVVFLFLHRSKTSRGKFVESLVGDQSPCIDMLCLEALVQFGSGDIQSVRSGDVSAHGMHG